ncbi:rho GTPase-activating protein 17-like [Uloborus diversus]|uniref:rho GTPase-activating protein 17-like n=1 Tax=Uloborus diversus TaxID=327109 RepID=UPI00240A4350|nr:rho GTPase-activating protein 17-like [Uloborus diversus]
MTTPICRCRVLYLGSAVPHITKDGLQGIQEPLRDLYPEQGSFSAKGIDSWLSVWSNGILMENVDESMRQVTRFFSIETLHYCAAIRYVVVPGNNGERVEKFLPLDSPFARYADPSHPPLFACILRRTTGIKVLECHAFICKKEAAANALVRCCFHSYADNMQAKQLDENPYYMENRRSQSLSGLNTLEKVEVWRSKGEGSTMTNVSNNTQKQVTNGIKPVPPPRNGVSSNQDDDNYKIWTGIAPTERELLYVDATGTMRSLKSATGTLRSAQAKIRQMAAGIPRPPPPPSPGLFNGKDKNNKATKPSKSKNKKKQKEQQQQQQQQMLMNGSARMMNGMRPVSVMGHYGSIPPPPPQAQYRNPGFYTERRIHKNGRLPIPGHEEPIYMSANRPLSPVSTYQPAVFPYEQYFMQYGTAPRNMPLREGHMRARASHQTSQQHYYHPQTFHPPPPPEKPFVVETPDSPNDKDTSGDSKDDSPFNTGIYKKKGHLNERAFSYSIRQEHRSRSNSLASLQFFANNDSLDNGGDGQERSRDEDRKERELAQLVSGLELKDNGMPGTTSSRRGESNFIKKKSFVYQR